MINSITRGLIDYTLGRVCVCAKNVPTYIKHVWSLVESNTLEFHILFNRACMTADQRSLFGLSDEAQEVSYVAVIWREISDI